MHITTFMNPAEIAKRFFEEIQITKSRNFAQCLELDAPLGLRTNFKQEPLKYPRNGRILQGFTSLLVWLLQRGTSKRDSSKGLGQKSVLSVGIFMNKLDNNLSQDFNANFLVKRRHFSITNSIIEMWSFRQSCVILTGVLRQSWS